MSAFHTGSAIRRETGISDSSDLRMTEVAEHSTPVGQIITSLSQPARQKTSERRYTTVHHLLRVISKLLDVHYNCNEFCGESQMKDSLHAHSSASVYVRDELASPSATMLSH